MGSLDCAGFIFYSNFDSGNLAKVEWVPKTESGKFFECFKYKKTTF